MNYDQFRNRLLAMFAPDKLEPAGEWGFLNETGRDIGKIAYATNLTPDTILQAAGYSADFILTHHDAWGFIYGMKDQCVRLLEQHRIAHAFFHAPLDDADFGTSASLAEALQLQNCHRAIPVGIYTAAVIGQLPVEMSFQLLNESLCRVLGEPVTGYRNKAGTIRRICIATGGGMMTNDMKWAVDASCDAYITGEYMLYSQLYARFAGMDLFIGSHTYTEIFGVRSLVERLVDGTDMTAVRLFEGNY
jgi:putative NIF3 family GTP cyclohydrolase 1 type 2